MAHQPSHTERTSLLRPQHIEVQSAAGHAVRAKSSQHRKWVVAAVVTGVCVLWALALHWLPAAKYSPMTSPPYRATTLNTRTTSDVGHFLVLTDIHFDPYYKPQSHVPQYDVCRQSLYLRQCPAPSANVTLQYNASATEFSLFTPPQQAFVYGQYYCDPSVQFLTESLQQLAVTLKNDNIKLDAILLLGDYAAHYLPCKEAVQHAVQTVMQQLGAALPDVTIIPVVGNTDVYPTFGVPLETNGSLNTNSSNQLTELQHVFGEVNTVLAKGSHSSTFDAGGYYHTTVPHTNIHMLALNTLVYSPSHIGVAGQPPRNCNERADDPLQQFAWLESQLEHIDKLNKHHGNKHRNKRHAAYIVGHVPPGVKAAHESWCNRYTERYLDVATKYNETIVAHFYGDHSYDELRLLTTNATHNANTTAAQGNVAMLSPLFIVPGMSPRKNCNPAARVYQYNTTTGALLDYMQYYINLAAVQQELAVQALEPYHNHTSPLQWQQQYTMSQQYDTTDLSSSSISELYTKFHINERLRHRYKTGISVKRVYGGEDPRTSLELLCDMSVLDSNQNNECRQTGKLPVIA